MEYQGHDVIIVFADSSPLRRDEISNSVQISSEI